MTALVCAGARPLAELAFGRGLFTAEDVALTAAVVPILALADPVFGAGQVLAQVHIAGGDTRRPMVIGFQRIAVKAVLSLALVPVFGIFGLAASSSLSSLLRTALLWKRLPADVRPAARPLLRAAGVILAIAACAGLAAWLVFLVPVRDAFLPQAARAAGAACAAVAAHVLIALTGSPGGARPRAAWA